MAALCFAQNAMIVVVQNLRKSARMIHFRTRSIVDCTNKLIFNWKDYALARHTSLSTTYWYYSCRPLQFPYADQYMLLEWVVPSIIRHRGFKKMWRLATIFLKETVHVWSWACEPLKSIGRSLAPSVLWSCSSYWVFSCIIVLVDVICGFLAFNLWGCWDCCILS